MQFIDHTGHIFEMPTYTVNPIGYEYETTPYIFWLNTEYSSKLSVGNYYAMPVRFISDEQNLSSISLESSVFSLYNPGEMTESALEIDEAALTDKIETLQPIEVDGKYLYTFYVFAEADEEGSWMTNIMIRTEYEWTPVTVGGIFIDETEQLTINAANMGVRLPKDIIKAVWRGSFYNDSFDAALYNEKLKEYLMNHMLLKSECGNYNSAIGALKWFGWGKHLTISKLMKTDNEFMEQFVHDYFDSSTDILDSFKSFKNSAYISLYLNDNIETGDNEEVNYAESGKEFFGEGTPTMESLTDSSATVVKKYDEGDIEFVKPYYDFCIEELGVKLACLAYMYKKYFLPVHLGVHSASVRHKVYANDMKLVCCSRTMLTEDPIFIGGSKSLPDVSFPGSGVHYIYDNPQCIDKNTYLSSDNESDSRAYIDIVNASIPIKVSLLNWDEKDAFCTGSITFVRDGEVLHSAPLDFIMKSDTTELSFVIVPYLFDSKFNSRFWESGKYELIVALNGRIYSYPFSLKTPDLRLNIGRLVYHYDGRLHRQIESIDGDGIHFNSYMYVPSLADIRNVNFYDELMRMDGDSNKLAEYILSQDIHPNVPYADKYMNRICIVEIKKNGAPIASSVESGNTAKPYAEEKNTDLFSAFFEDDGSCKVSGIDGYDFYLMRDAASYYGALISKETIDTATELGEPSLEGYSFEIVDSCERVLVDRLMFEDKEGNNQFENDDIILASVSNSRFPFVLKTGSKWTFTRVGSDDEHFQVANGDSAILGLPKISSTVHQSGYYNISVSYSLDGVYNNVKTAKSRILIK